MPSRLDARLRRLEMQAMTSDLPPGHGLAALLDYARRRPTVEACDTETPPTIGLGLLLWEAQHVRATEPSACTAPLPTD
jgi:hypothetical protein